MKKKKSSDSTKDPLAYFGEVTRLKLQCIQTEKKLLLERTNISHAGKIVEDYVKKEFQKILPDWFKVISGYIIYKKNKNAELKISPHIDVMIIDTRAAHLFFANSRLPEDSDFIFQEAVVGIFEVKATLNKAKINKALDHLTNIIDTVSITRAKSKKVNSIGSFHSNPIVGVIGLNLEQKKAKEKKNFQIEPKHKKPNIIFTFDGFVQFLEKDNKIHFHPENVEYKNCQLDHPNAALNLILQYLNGTRGKNFGNGYDNVGNGCDKDEFDVMKYYT